MAGIDGHVDEPSRGVLDGCSLWPTVDGELAPSSALRRMRRVRHGQPHLSRVHADPLERHRS
jgi:hypothetical protein